MKMCMVGTCIAFKAFYVNWCKKLLWALESENMIIFHEIANGKSFISPMVIFQECGYLFLHDAPFNAKLK